MSCEGEWRARERQVALPDAVIRARLKARADVFAAHMMRNLRRVSLAFRTRQAAMPAIEGWVESASWCERPGHRPRVENFESGLYFCCGKCGTQERVPDSVFYELGMTPPPGNEDAGAFVLLTLAEGAETVRPTAEDR